MSYKSSINPECPVCEHPINLEVSVTFPIPESGYGPPENYDPGAPGEVELTEKIPPVCPWCRHMFDKEQAQAFDVLIDKACDEFDYAELWNEVNEPPDYDED